MGELVHISRVLGQPTPVDPTRPNEHSGATPLKHDESDFPLYRIRKVCDDFEDWLGRRFHGCGRSYVGFSLTPQYDDEEPRNAPCDPCLDRFLLKFHQPARPQDHSDLRRPRRTSEGE
jgi:hypothetical protein